jgi:hypothetical protein
LLFAICSFVVSDLTTLYVYTTDGILFVSNSSLFRIGTVLTSYLTTASFIISQAITINSEGRYWHTIPAAIFFLISIFQRFLFFQEEVTNTISKFITFRKVATIISSAGMIIGLFLSRIEYNVIPKTKRDKCLQVLSSDLGEFLFGTCEITLIFLLLWDRIDVGTKIKTFHKKNSGDFKHCIIDGEEQHCPDDTTGFVECKN